MHRKQLRKKSDPIPNRAATAAGAQRVTRGVSFGVDVLADLASTLTNRRQEDTTEKDQKGPSVMFLGRRVELGRQPVVVRHGVWFVRDVGGR